MPIRIHIPHLGSGLALLRRRQLGQDRHDALPALPRRPDLLPQARSDRVPGPVRQPVRPRRDRRPARRAGAARPCPSFRQRRQRGQRGLGRAARLGHGARALAAGDAGAALEVADGEVVDALLGRGGRAGAVGQALREGDAGLRDHLEVAPAQRRHGRLGPAVLPPAVAARRRAAGWAAGVAGVVGVGLGEGEGGLEGVADLAPVPAAGVARVPELCGELEDLFFFDTDGALALAGLPDADVPYVKVRLLVERWVVQTELDARAEAFVEDAHAARGQE